MLRLIRDRLPGLELQEYVGPVFLEEVSHSLGLPAGSPVAGLPADFLLEAVPASSTTTATSSRPPTAPTDDSKPTESGQGAATMTVEADIAVDTNLMPIPG